MMLTSGLAYKICNHWSALFHSTVKSTSLSIENYLTESLVLILNITYYTTIPAYMVL